MMKIGLTQLVLTALLLSLTNGSVLAEEGGQQPNSPAKVTDKWAKHYFDRLALFDEENAGLKNVVLVGSSHVEGLDSARLLPNWRVINRGIASDRIGIGERGILHRLESSVFECNPAIVVLQNGVNDLGELKRHGTPSIPEIDQCYRKVVEQIRTRLPHTPLVIVGLLPTRDRYADLMPLIHQLEARLKKIAEDYGCVFLEVIPSLSDSEGLLREEYSREGLHMTGAGYEVWANLLDQVLTSQLGSPVSADKSGKTRKSCVRQSASTQTESENK